MRNYLENLITEKGVSLETEIEIDGHIGLTYQMLVDYIVEMKPHHKQIRDTLVMIDFKGGDVFHYFDHLTKGMLKAIGY